MENTSSKVKASIEGFVIHEAALITTMDDLLRSMSLVELKFVAPSKAIAISNEMH